MKPIIIANWKLNPTSLKEAKKLFNSVCKKTKKEKAEIIFCPPFIYFPIFENHSPNIKTGAQNCFFENRGAFTGEVSACQLKDLKCSYVIVGHSERRKYFSETDEIVNKKVKAVLENKMTPILCIGETKVQRDAGEVQTVLKRELEIGLKNIPAAKISSQGLLAAYEPIWAIGTGRPCDVEEGQKMKLLIKKILSGIYSPALASKIRILYGGSVNPDNAAGYVKEAEFDGLLVGGASLKDKDFSQIIKNSV